jgi:hypothetical protein
MAVTTRESFHIIDGRQGPWVSQLRKTLKSHQTSLLILQASVASHLILNKLFSMKLAPESKPQDRITLFEFGRIVGRRNFELLAEAHQNSSLVIMLEELHYPVPKATNGRTRLLCSVVLRLGLDPVTAPRSPHPTWRMPIDTSDSLEAEVFFGELNENALTEAERNELRTLPAVTTTARRIPSRTTRPSSGDHRA